MLHSDKPLITRNLVNNFIRGLVKSAPILGAFLEQLIYGTLDKEAAQEETRKLHSALGEIVSQAKVKDIDLHALLDDLAKQAKFRKETTAEIAQVIALLEDPNGAAISSRLTNAVQRVLTSNEEQARTLLAGQDDIKGLITRLGERIGEGRVLGPSAQAGQNTPCHSVGGLLKEHTDILRNYLLAVVSDLGLWSGLGLGRNVRLQETYVAHYVQASSYQGHKCSNLVRENREKETVRDTELLHHLLQAKYSGRYLLIEGPAGSGKTTLLRYWTLTLARTACQGGAVEHVPILIPLSLVGQLCGDDPSWDVPLVELVARQFPSADGKVSEQLSNCLASAIDCGHAIIMFDAIDEVPEEASNAIHGWLDRIRHSAPKCPLVITSRPDAGLLFAVLRAKGQCECFGISPLNSDQQREFVFRWFKSSGDARRANKMMKELNDSPRLLQMAARPIFLTMMCIEFEVTNRISTSQAAIFETFVRALLELWDLERGVGLVPDRRNGVPLDLKLHILEAVASRFFERGKRVFDERELTDCVQELLHKLRAAVAANEIITQIKNRSGLLVSDRMGNHRFCHPLFQEFFVARYRFKRNEKGEKQAQWIGDRFWDSRFKNVVAFYAELVAHSKNTHLAEG